MPGDPPYRSICCWCISSTSSRERNSGSTRVPAAPLLGQLLESLAVPFVGPLLRGVELLLAGERRRGRSDDESRAIRADVERRLRVDFQQIQNWPVDDQRQAVPVFGELLKHQAPLLPYFQCYTNGDTAKTAIPGVRNWSIRGPSLNRAVNQRGGVNGESGEFARLREANAPNQHG